MPLLHLYRCLAGSGIAAVCRLRARYDFDCFFPLSNNLFCFLALISYRCPCCLPFIIFFRLIYKVKDLSVESHA